MDHIILKLEGNLEIRDFDQSLKISWEWACSGTWVSDAQYLVISIKQSDSFFLEFSTTEDFDLTQMTEMLIYSPSPLLAST